MTLSSTTTVEQLELRLAATEGEHVEFKEAQGTYSFEDLLRYCCALANEGGGEVILGVSDRRPRRVVGSNAFTQPERTRRALVERLPLRVGFTEIAHPAGRVLVFHVPSRPLGVPMKAAGVYWARETDALVPMSEQRLRGVFEEAGRDFSAEVCSEASLADLEPNAIEDYRRRWLEKSQNGALSGLTHEQLLRDSELVLGDDVTYAALILFGTREALGRFLAQAEIVFEYRSAETAGPAQHRKEYRQGFFSFYDDLWKTVNLRNDLQHYQTGLFIFDIPTFAEKPVREVVLNAVSHRDYQLGGSVFLRQFPRRLVVASPGGLPLGITPDNVLDRQSPGNRRIAEAFGRCGLVERSGQGMNLMFEQSIRDGKRVPDFAGTDAYQVVVTLHGEVQDAGFVQFLQKVGRETVSTFDTHDLLILDLVHREEPIPQGMQQRLRRLADLGVLERIGRGRASKYLLARHYYTMIGKRGVYTRRRGLDTAANKALLLDHLQQGTAAGSPISELQEVLPGLSRDQVRSLLEDMRAEGKVSLVGQRRWARWVALPLADRNDLKADAT